MDRSRLTSSGERVLAREERAMASPEKPASSGGMTLRRRTVFRSSVARAYWPLSIG